MELNLKFFPKTTWLAFFSPFGPVNLWISFPLLSKEFQLCTHLKKRKGEKKNFEVKEK